MIELPKEKLKATRVNPKSIIIFSSPKTGKTEAVSRLENNLIIDLERGSGYVDAMKIDVLTLAEKQEIEPIQILKQIIDEVKEQNKAKGGYIYDYITIDTISALEDIVVPIANKLHRDSAQGRNWQGDDARTLPNGQGWGLLRTAMTLVLNELETLSDTLIILGHTKSKLINVEGKEMEAKGLDLAGKLSSIVCAQCDAIAYLYRKDNQTIANFKPSESLVVGSRPEHLKGKEIVLLESDENGNLKDNWNQIFLK